jgi:hypothetical protein
MYQVIKIRTAAFRKTRKRHTFWIDYGVDATSADEETCRVVAEDASVLDGCAYIVERIADRVSVAEFENGTEVAIGATRFAK